MKRNDANFPWLLAVLTGGLAIGCYATAVHCQHLVSPHHEPLPPINGLIIWAPTALCLGIGAMCSWVALFTRLIERVCRA
jgi:hypothetical protein